MKCCLKYTNFIVFTEEIIYTIIIAESETFNIAFVLAPSDSALADFSVQDYYVYAVKPTKGDLK